MGSVTGGIVFSWVTGGIGFGWIAGGVGFDWVTGGVELGSVTGGIVFGWVTGGPKSAEPEPEATLATDVECCDWTEIIYIPYSSLLDFVIRQNQEALSLLVSIFQAIFDNINNQMPKF